LALTQPQPNHYELHDPDVRLMLQVRDGDAAAFTELVLRYQNRLLTVLEHLVGSREQAEDLAQDVFVRVFKARHRYEPEAKAVYDSQ
jgi:RNA polymerase sigma-70 factor, ECF subfamily